MSAVPAVCSFWAGSDLSPLAAICLSSFAEMGHRVVLYAYERPRGVPASVEIADASTILPADHLFMHKTGMAPFSDRFRYELLAKEKGVWVDCDMLCVRPIELQPYIFGWENPRRINTAILSLPKESRLLADLRGMFSKKYWVPPWYGLLRRQRYRLKYFFGQDFDYRQMNLGTIGPFALTHYAGVNAVTEHAAPQEVYYPVSYDETPVLLQEPERLRERLTERTRCIHLWNSRLVRDFSTAPFPQGSFAASVLAGTWRKDLA